MANVSDEFFDSGLDWVDTNGTILHILPGEYSTFTGVTGNSLGNKTGINPAAPSNRTAGGREVVISAITGGSVTGTGTATHWALVSASVFVACGALASSQGVTSGNTFSLTQFALGIPDPA